MFFPFNWFIKMSKLRSRSRNVASVIGQICRAFISAQNKIFEGMILVALGMLMFATLLYPTLVDDKSF